MKEFSDSVLIDREYVKNYILEYAFRHNYTTNREAITEAIIDRYTYWPDTSDEDAVRREFIHVCFHNYLVFESLYSFHLYALNSEG